ncbi:MULTISPECIES: flippase [unclassified Haloferax]|uniref:flippase n=1 Tax=unclassified Haloferax TaxID=2625095 RepID=UPI0028769A3F|nr:MULTISPECIES: flippase [unclassified Haloferax]MDS0239874.1 flippase [Haloferax sp. S2CR25]MDS0442995.1 flippase [Haloferax sp. S2CR25-2]
MRIGQTSFIFFVSKLVASLLGFVATIYFARTLGPSVLGYYALVVSLVAWIELGGRSFSTAVKKRISEATDPNQYFTAGGTTLVFVGSLGILLILVFQSQVNNYVGENVALFAAALLVANLLYAFVSAVLEGERQVHISGILVPLRTGIRSAVQIFLVLYGFQLVGMLAGYFIAGITTGIIGLAYISSRFEMPKRHHFRSLYDYAKFSWLGTLKARTYNDVDILVLGALTSSGFVGIYSVAWGISKFMAVFDSSLRSALFPEISKAKVENNEQIAGKLVSDSLRYNGFVSIPGMFGGIVLGDQILQIYGPEFVQGTTVLNLLILATVIYGYQTQLTNAIDALNRPKISFNINFIFILTNVVLNILLISTVGWVGAAVATVLSASLGVVLAFRALTNLLEFGVPVNEIVYQVGSGLLMSIVVITLQDVLVTTQIVDRPTVRLVILITTGAAVYFLTLLSISRDFRETVDSNLPFKIPFVN